MCAATRMTCLSRSPCYPYQTQHQNQKQWHVATCPGTPQSVFTPLNGNHQNYYMPVHCPTCRSTGDVEAGIDLGLIDQYLSLLTGAYGAAPPPLTTSPSRPPPARAPASSGLAPGGVGPVGRASGPFMPAAAADWVGKTTEAAGMSRPSNLRRLGLDRPSLIEQAGAPGALSRPACTCFLADCLRALPLGRAGDPASACESLGSLITSCCVIVCWGGQLSLVCDAGALCSAS
jgi:hypothetical protein